MLSINKILKLLLDIKPKFLSDYLILAGLYVEECNIFQQEILTIDKRVYWEYVRINFIDDVQAQINAVSFQRIIYTRNGILFQFHINLKPSN